MGIKSGVGGFPDAIRYPLARVQSAAMSVFENGEAVVLKLGGTHGRNKSIHRVCVRLLRLTERNFIVCCVAECCFQTLIQIFDEAFFMVINNAEF